MQPDSPDIHLTIACRHQHCWEILPVFSSFHPPCITFTRTHLHTGQTLTKACSVPWLCECAYHTPWQLLRVWIHTSPVRFTSTQGAVCVCTGHISFKHTLSRCNSTLLSFQVALHHRLHVEHVLEESPDLWHLREATTCMLRSLYIGNNGSKALGYSYNQIKYTALKSK